MFLSDINVGGINYKLAPVLPSGTCDTPAGTEAKTVSFSDTFELNAGVIFTVTFTYTNTYGDGATSYPKLALGALNLNIQYANGSYAGSGAWGDGATGVFLVKDNNTVILLNHKEIEALTV